MTRGRTIALVILALVVATVVAMGPVRVWDALTLREVQRVVTTRGSEISEIASYRVRFWDDSGPLRNAVGVVTIRDTQGNTTRTRNMQDGHWEVRQWECGELRGMMIYDLRGVDSWPPPLDFIRRNRSHGVIWEPNSHTGDPIQFMTDGSEQRISPPWFTEEEILQSVLRALQVAGEGVEE